MIYKIEATAEYYTAQKFLNTIKFIRAATDGGLKEAKQMFDDTIHQHKMLILESNYNMIQINELFNREGLCGYLTILNRNDNILNLLNQIEEIESEDIKRNKYMKANILVFTKFGNPIVISTSGTVKIGDVGFLDGKLIKKTSDFQVFIKPVVYTTNEISENIMNKISNGELKDGDTINEI